MQASFFVENEAAFVAKVQNLGLRSFDNIKEIIDIESWDDVRNLRQEAKEHLPKFAEIVAETYFIESLIADLLIKHGF